MKNNFEHSTSPESQAQQPYEYLNIQDINLGSLGTLLQGETNASSNFGYRSQPGKPETFGRNWNSQTRIGGALRRDKNILKFTAEDMYPLMDETHRFVQEKDIVSKIFAKTSYGEKSSDTAVDFLRGELFDFYEEVVNRKEHKDMDLFETLTWDELRRFVSKTVELIQNNNEDDIYYTELEHWRRLLNRIKTIIQKEAEANVSQR